MKQSSGIMMLQQASAALLLVLLVGCATTGLVGCATTGRTSDTVDPIRVMTFNIRFNNPDDGADAWPNRRDMAASMLRFHNADIAGLQEALKGQIDDLQDRLPEYAWIGVGRTDGREAGEFTPIFYRKDRFDVLDHDTFWLSTTPDVPGSKSWDAALERIATWAEMHDRWSGRRLFVLNTHFDHVGEEARLESAKLIRQYVAERAEGLPVIVTGDFNTLEDSPPYQELVEGSLADAMHRSEQPHHGPVSTWNGFEAVEPGRRIDFIFVNDQFDVMRHAALSDTWEGRFPSDHLPVLAEVAPRR